MHTQYKNKSKHSEMGPVRQNPIHRTVSLFICVCIALCAIVAHNIAQNRLGNFPSYPPDNHHWSDDVYLREGRSISEIIFAPTVIWAMSYDTANCTYQSICCAFCELLCHFTVTGITSHFRQMIQLNSKNFYLIGFAETTFPNLCYTLA